MIIVVIVIIIIIVVVIDELFSQLKPVVASIESLGVRPGYAARFVSVREQRVRRSHFI